MSSKNQYKPPTLVSFLVSSFPTCSVEHKKAFWFCSDSEHLEAIFLTRHWAPWKVCPLILVPGWTWVFRKSLFLWKTFLCGKSKQWARRKGLCHKSWESSNAAFREEMESLWTQAHEQVMQNEQRWGFTVLQLILSNCPCLHFHHTVKSRETTVTVVTVHVLH